MTKNDARTLKKGISNCQGQFPSWVKMTAGSDIRPMTASGSIRTSDVAHQRNLRTAEIESDDLERRAARTLVLEEIEDFEHKLGWKMRKSLGEPLAPRRALPHPRGASVARARRERGRGREGGRGRERRDREKNERASE